MSHVITKLVVPINRTDSGDKDDVCPKDDDSSTETDEVVCVKIIISTDIC